MSADYFTLNPKYERYELGIAELQRETFFPFETIAKGVDLPGGTAGILGIIGSIGIFIIIFAIGQPSKQVGFRGSFVGMVIASLVLLVVLRIVYDLARKPEERRFNRLKQQGVLTDGKVTRAWYDLEKLVEPNAMRVGSSGSIRWRRTLNVSYHFRTPEGHRLTGLQSHFIDNHYGRDIDRDALLNEPVPARDTPIRILYLDEMTYVML